MIDYLCCKANRVKVEVALNRDVWAKPLHFSVTSQLKISHCFKITSSDSILIGSIALNKIFKSKEITSLEINKAIKMCINVIKFPFPGI